MSRKSKPEIVISSRQKDVRLPRKKLAELVQFIERQEGAAIAHVDIAVVDQDEISLVNRQYLSHVGPTDVISFDLSDAGATGLTVQLVICGRVAAENAVTHGTSVEHELMLYVVHGLLHQMGYDDQTVRAAARMHAREDEILSAFSKRPGRRSARR